MSESPPPPKVAKQASYFDTLQSLEGFELIEVLGSNTARKSVFLLLHNTREENYGILLLHKLAFPENTNDLKELVTGSELILVSDNDVYGKYELQPPSLFATVTCTIIYPATQKHIEKYRTEQPHLIIETIDDYNAITLPFINESQFSCDWVYNILDGQKEQDSILFKDTCPTNGFFLCKDLKWDGKSIEEMYYQALIVRRGIKSVRDLTAEHIPLLENILHKASNAIEEKHGYPRSQLLAYFHYQPSFYHLHVHFRSTKSESNVTNIPLREVIENLRVWPDYYQKAPLGFFIKEGEQLFKQYEGASRVFT